MVGTVLNTNSARIVDPVLSTVVQGYKHPHRVGSLIFPPVPVSVSGGKVIQFGTESFKLYNVARAPGGRTKRIQFGYEGLPYALAQDALEGKVPREWQRDASQVPGIDLGTRAVNGVMQTLTLSLEVEQATIATSAANYDNNHKVALAGADKWSTDTGKPVADITDGKEAVRKTTGMEPNVCVLSPDAWSAAKNNPSVIERFKFTTDQPITLSMFAALIEVERVVVGKAIYADDDGAFHDVWGNACVLAYAPQTPAGQEEPSFGYTYTMEGHPMVEAPYWDNSEKSWIYGVTNERAPQLTGAVAGFLIQNPK